MIPAFNASMVLPPFIGESPGVRAMMAPYKSPIADFVRRFATTAERVTLLQGFLAYRLALHACGVIDGFQWVDGSFVEDVERSRKRAPADIDLVTFASRPAAVDGADFAAWLAVHGPLFDRDHTTATYSCDAFFVDTRKRGDLIVDDTRYWFGLFSHQRDTSLWKGMIQIPMQSNDDEALTFMNNLLFDEAEVPHA